MCSAGTLGFPLPTAPEQIGEANIAASTWSQHGAGAQGVYSARMCKNGWLDGL